MHITHTTQNLTTVGHAKKNHDQTIDFGAFTYVILTFQVTELSVVLASVGLALLLRVLLSPSVFEVFGISVCFPMNERTWSESCRKMEADLLQLKKL